MKVLAVVVLFCTLLGAVWASGEVECALCGAALNEIEGLLSENLTQQELEDFLDKKVCPFFGSLQDECDDLISMLPMVVTKLRQHVKIAQVCEEINFCDHGDWHPDMAPLEEFIVDLDLAPRLRWQKIWTTPRFKKNILSIITAIESISAGNLTYSAELGELILQFFPTEYAEEIRGGAEALGIQPGLLAWANLGYELSDACTSIVAQNAKGEILHARNLDFGAGLGFSNALRNMTFQATFQKGGKTLYKATMYTGYVGFLSAMKPGVFTVTVDTRFNTKGLLFPLWEMFYALTEKGYELVTFLTRDAIAQQTTWEGALNHLSNTPLLADVYLITAGTKPGEGAIISRNETGSRNTWMLDAKSGRWFEAETNYDHWDPAPWYDDRRYYANKGMEAIGQEGVTLEKMLTVLSTKPVLNRMTTYSILMNPTTSEYKAYSRYCNDPCPY
eukprot:TRINITY_DN1236_c0_g2_i1.p1 TRINITY_DN1236_c0_g2~~TRINITY_DN1236_c0_g2_i1.p1  ORF type:complete len:454 (+),score=73.02 TRINITY_DN1236_c0_g2_i1:25-1362(+)